MNLPKLTHTVLPKELTIGNGAIKKYLLYASSNPETHIKEVALLKIPAFAGIVKHKHDVYEEYVFFNDVEGVKITKCNPGDTHELEPRMFAYWLISIQYWK